jgi:peptidyl-prolyl cis-trans isomerase SurA
VKSKSRKCTNRIILQPLGGSILLALGLLVMTAQAGASPSRSAPILLDSVIATVNEKPITLRELEQRLTPPRRLSLDEAAKDQQVQALLDRMIFEQTLLSEAEAKRIEVDDSEVDRYMEEVAKRNNLSKAQLEKALTEQQKDVALYRNQIKLDILQSRLGSTYLQSSGAITKEEINTYINQHPELLQGGTQVKLSRILVSSSSRSDTEANARAQEALDKLKDGQSFESVAKAYSDAPEAAEGGSLGLVAEKDLSSDIFTALIGLKSGELSEAIRTDAGYLVFKVEDRVAVDGSNRDAVEQEVRLRLQGRKQQSKIQDFFTSELFKNHTIEKKI